MDDRIHRAEAVYLDGDPSSLLDVVEVADDGRSAPLEEIAYGR